MFPKFILGARTIRVNAVFQYRFMLTNQTSKNIKILSRLNNILGFWPLSGNRGGGRTTSFIDCLLRSALAQPPLSFRSPYKPAVKLQSGKLRIRSASEYDTF